MILRMTVRNLYSFRDETEISFVAGKGATHSEQVSRAKRRDDISVLKAGILYGANASGKSNVIKAVSALKRIALSGVQKRQVEPFRLVTPNNEPSMVELEIKIGGQYYAYGVEFTKCGVFEEWLYVINNRSERKVFERRVVSGENEFTFGDIVGDAETGQLVRFIGLSTPAADSFLSEYVKRNGKGLAAINVVHRWMRDRLKIVFPESRFSGIAVNMETDRMFATATESLLKYFNTGITKIRRDEIKRENIDMPRSKVDEVLEELKPGAGIAVTSLFDSSTYFFEMDANGEARYSKQVTIHENGKGEEYKFEMGEESDGSIRLLDFIPMLIDLRLNAGVYLIDEIDRSMHPMLTRKLLEYYFGHLSEELDTQLIFTTHESHLLNLDLIRTDEVWFVEKDRTGSSHMYSLAEYKPREDVQKGYLQGRYGAIPFFAPTSDLRASATESIFSQEA